MRRQHTTQAGAKRTKERRLPPGSSQTQQAKYRRCLLDREHGGVGGEEAREWAALTGDGSSVRPAARGEDPGEMGAAQSLLL